MAKSKYPRWRLPLLRRSYSQSSVRFPAPSASVFRANPTLAALVIGPNNVRKEKRGVLARSRGGTLLLLLHVSTVGGEKQASS